MSIDERELGERLDDCFEAVKPSMVPVDSVLRQGKAIKFRRRTGAVATVAVVAAGVVGVPALLHQQDPPEAVQLPRHYAVTVRSGGEVTSPAGLIASGTVNGKGWQVIASKPGTGGADIGEQCFAVQGTAFGAGTGETENCVSALTTTSADSVEGANGGGPVTLEALSGGLSQSFYGAVASNVSYVTVTLHNGTVLTLHPVSVYGVRMVAFAVPKGGVINETAAYSATGEIASAVPFAAPDGATTIATWLKPGQQGLARATRLVAQGTTRGTAWSVTVYEGPWGICLVTNLSVSNCYDLTSGAAPLGAVSLEWSERHPELFYGSTVPSVARMIITMADGSTVHVDPVAVGPQKFYAFVTEPGDKALRWAAYNNVDSEVASGSLAVTAAAAS